VRGGRRHAEPRRIPPAPALLADWLPWAGLVAPGVVLNKDGSFQRTARFRGPDLDSATQGELIATSARLNNALRRMGSGWALFIEAERRARRRLSALGVSRAAVVAGGRGTPRHLRGIGQPLRERLSPDAGVPAARGIRARAAKMLYENRPPKAWTGASGCKPSSRKRIASLTCSMA
jgi:hypothetical protein